MATTGEGSSRAAIGIDVGGTKLLAVVVDAAGVVLEEQKVPTPEGGDGIVEAIVAISGAWGAQLPVGLGVAGLVDREGVLQVGPNLLHSAGYPFASRLRDGLGPAAGRVTVDNDATVATWGELKAGAATGARDAILVTLGTGIGAGLVSDGRLQRGAHGFAGEAGHTTVDPRGPACPCGRRGCWERYASGSGLGRLARVAVDAGAAPELVRLAGGDPDAVRGEHVTMAAAAGDEGAVAVLHEFAWWVAVGLANLVAVLDPEVVVIGGGLAEMGDLLLDPVRASCAELVFGAGRRPEVPIVAAALGEHAGAVGAALLAFAPDDG